jgi:hypothetical protein
MSWEQKMIKHGQEQVTTRVGEAIEAFVNTHDFTESFLHDLIGKTIYSLRQFGNSQDTKYLAEVTDLIELMAEYVATLPKQEEPLD